MSERRQAVFAAAGERLLSKIDALLTSDTRVVAAWLSGSVGQGEGDEWADYDLHVVIEDGSVQSFLAEREKIYASIGDVALLQDDIPGQSNVGDRFHLVHFATPYGPVEVDWSFLRASEARKPLACQVLFERQAITTNDPPALTDAQRADEARKWALFFWAMAPIAVRLCARGDLVRAVGQTRLLQRALISLWRLLVPGPVTLPWEPDANNALEDDLDAKLPKLGQVATLPLVIDLIVDLCKHAERLQEALKPFGADVQQAIISQTAALTATAREAVAAGEFRRRRYR